MGTSIPLTAVHRDCCESFRYAAGPGLAATGKQSQQSLSELTDEIMSALGWDDSDDTDELRNDDPDRMNDNEVTLRNSSL